MIKNKLGKLVPIITGLLALLLLAVPVQANGAAVSIADVTVGSGAIVTLPINITGVTNLGSATIWLSYNEDVVTVDSVADGGMGTVVYGINNTAGLTKMTCLKAAGMSGSFVFAQVTLHAATTSVNLTCDLDLDVKEFVNTSLNPIAVTVDDGVFNIAVLPGAPTIAFSPASLSFSATEGGANPSSKTLQIWNGGAGTLAWSVSDNAGWLALTPGSGTSTGEHNTVTASVTVGSLSAGDYSGTITISATGATSQSVSVSLHVSAVTPPVGGTAYWPNKLLMLLPWIAIGVAIIVGTSLLVRRRRSATR